ncbi:MAG: hypothetical protein BAA04_01305 [Firmicutes bacterium ZCTH02-B6]|nr:MAG: hypothetical protein BAA04_01305 [Firmicutes bacterium ZCTH02-B6]
MRRVDIRTIPEGATLARPLVDQRGAFVLAAGKTVTESMAERLWERGFRYAYVHAPGFEGLDVREPMEPQTYQQVRHLLAGLVNQVKQAKDPSLVDVPVLALQEATKQACDELVKQNQGFLLYPAWGTLADRFLASVVNIACVAARIGVELADKDSARHLFLAGLLQDLGTWFTDRAAEHVTASLAIVRGYRELSAWVKHIVGDHHERLDGSGFPQGKSGHDIHLLSRIMQVAVAYVELLQDPRNPALPHEAQEHLMAEAGVLFDWDVVQTLRKVVPGYPTGSVVRLSTSQLGVVVHPGPASLNRPRVRVLSKKSDRRDEGSHGVPDDADAPDELQGPANVGDGGQPAAYEEIDLAADHAVAIVRLLES